MDNRRAVEVRRGRERCRCLSHRTGAPNIHPLVIHFPIALLVAAAASLMPRRKASIRRKCEPFQ